MARHGHGGEERVVMRAENGTLYFVTQVETMSLFRFVHFGYYSPGARTFFECCSGGVLKDRGKAKSIGDLCND